MRRILGILAFLALALPLGAQELTIDAPNLVASDEQFNVTFTFDGEDAPSDFSWSPGGDFKLVWGPQKGTSTSISIVNGKRSKSSKTTYTYVLMPNKAGTFTIGPATATVKGRQISSGTKSIQVVAEGQQRSGQASGGNGRQGSAAADGTISDKDIFMRLTLSKSSAVVGETVSATLKLYQRVSVAGFEDARFPSFDGFWSQEVQAPSNIEFHRETVNGQIYNAAVLRSWNLVPQRAGDLRIDPAELVCLVNVRVSSGNNGSIFDSFFQDDYRTIRKRVVTPAYTVHVSSLPAGAPASFGGGVGKFSLKASLSTDSLKTHDAASLVVTVSGTGNVSLLEAPKLSFPPDFEVYDVKTSGGKGSKTFEYPFIPRSHGDFVIGPVEYSYYDIAEGRYVTLVSAPMPLHVERGAVTEQQGPAVGQFSPSAQKDVKDLGTDIRFISTRKPAFSGGAAFFVWSPLFWGILALLAVLAAAVYFAFRKMAAMRADVAGSRNRGAVKMARKRLAAAGEYLQKNLYTAFYEELHRALLGFVSDKLNMDASDMTRENIAAKFMESGVTEGLAEEFCSLLDACDYARYAPDAGHEAMNAHYESAVSAISRIDSCMKKKVSPRTAALLALLMLVPFAGRAADYPDSLWNAGVSAYSEGQWAKASKAWGELVSAGMVSPELYTNLGDACFKNEDYAHAILYYERALKLDPSYSDARYNLRFAGQRVQDRIESVPEFFLVSWMRSVGWKLSSNAWAVLFLVLFAAALAMLLLFLLGRSAGGRKAGFFAGIVLLLLSLGALGFASWQKKDFENSNAAIVMSPVVSVKSAPGGGDSKDLFILHEGTKVLVFDSVAEWLNIELSDGRQGWVRADNVEKI